MSANKIERVGLRRKERVSSRERDNRRKGGRRQVTREEFIFGDGGSCTVAISAICRLRVLV